MATETKKTPPTDEERKRSLQMGLQGTGRSAFILVIANIWWAQGVDAAWLAGAGGILLGIGGLQRWLGMRPNRFELVFGTVAVGLGVIDLCGIAVPIGLVAPALVAAWLLHGLLTILSNVLTRKKAR